jgi:hypothetical protein
MKADMGGNSNGFKKPGYDKADTGKYAGDE